MLGAKQTKLPTDLVIQAQGLGDRFAYVLIQGQQPNAVDFCIALYLRELLARDPKAVRVILSKDNKGFDPLVRHLVAERGFEMRRVNAPKEAFPVEKKKSPAAKNPGDPYARLLELLAKEKRPPLKRKGLENRVRTHLSKLSPAECDALVARLFEEGKVADVEGKLEYAA